jgi:hypothetical protein
VVRCTAACQGSLVMLLCLPAAALLLLVSDTTAHQHELQEPRQCRQPLRLCMVLLAPAFLQPQALHRNHRLLVSQQRQQRLPHHSHHHRSLLQSQ